MPRTKKQDQKASGPKAKGPASGLLPLKIQSRSYSKLEEQTLFITHQLKETLEKRKRRDGSNHFDGLLRMGFRGGKHLIEMVREELGSDCEIVLSHADSSLAGKRVTVNFDKYREAGQSRFMEIYRQTGLRTATDYLNQQFPSTFTKSYDDVPPGRKEVKKVLGDLSSAVAELPKKNQKQLPQQIAELVDKQGPEFAFELLSAVDSAIPRGQERIRLALKDVIQRLAQEPASALDELTSLMDEWSLLQVTSLLNVLKGRLHAIETFEEIILDENTYELKGNKSVHRALERSMWILSDDYWIAQSNKTLRTLIGNDLAKEDKKYRDNRPDFACVDAVGKGTVIVEIKRPSLELAKDEVDQAERYLRIISKRSAAKKRTTVYLIGGKITSEAGELSEMRKYPILMTYQDVIERARRRYQEYLRVVEGN